jgi:hypothetical protein
MARNKLITAAARMEVRNTVVSITAWYQGEEGRSGESGIRN